MQNFLRLTKQAIDRHGISVTLKTISAPVYNHLTGQATSEETAYVIKSYPRQVVANQYNMPNMLGKELIDFYISGSDLYGLQPKTNDKINFNSADYTILRVKEHRAENTVLLYIVTSVKT